MGINVTFPPGPYTEGATYPGSDGRDYLYQNGCMKRAPAQAVEAVPEKFCYEAGDTLPDECSGIVVVCLTNGDEVPLACGDTVPADIFGWVFIAPGSAKAKYIPGKVEVPELPEQVPPAQESFCAGETLPNTMQGIVEVCLEDGSIVPLTANDLVPATIEGCVVVDEVSNRAHFSQNAVKPPAPYVPVKSIFKPGDTLPASAAGSISICVATATGQSLVPVSAGSTIPLTAQGCVAVDPVDGSMLWGQNAYKAPDMFVPDQELYKAGDTLPDSMLGTVEICLDDQTTTIIGAGDPLPTNMAGCVIVDETTNRAAWTQDIVKPGGKNYICQAFPPTAEQIAAGICIWRNDTVADQCLYTLNKDGETWFSSDKQLTDTFATHYVAEEAGTDDREEDYPAGATIMVLPGGFEICIPAKVVDTNTDTFAFEDVAGPAESGVDIFGTAFGPGDDLIRLASGQVYVPNDEIGPAVAVDPADPATFPADSGDYEKQCLTDAAGNMVGFVDASGPHLIVDNNDVATLTDNGNATARYVGQDSSGNAVNCDLSTTIYDGSDPCFHIIRSTKDNSEVYRHRKYVTPLYAKERVEFYFPEFTIPDTTANDIGLDTLTLMLSDEFTITNPNPCFPVQHMIDFSSIRLIGRLDRDIDVQMQIHVDGRVIVNNRWDSHGISEDNDRQWIDWSDNVSSHIRRDRGPLGVGGSRVIPWEIYYLFENDTQNLDGVFSQYKDFQLSFDVQYFVH